MNTDTDQSTPQATDYGPVIRDPVAFARSILGLQLGRTQIDILRSLAAHQRTIVVSGNGVGKTFAAMVGLLWFLCTRPDSVCLSTSRDFTAMTDTAYKPLKGLFETAQDAPYIPAQGGEAHAPPYIEMPAVDWYYRGISPSRPGGLEGRHNADCMVVIDEADKPEITADHFESAGTSITDRDDRMLAIANPPRDETDVVYDKMQSERWHTVQFSSFDSHNVRVEQGQTDAPPLPGLVTLDVIRADYEEWNGRDWPGDEAAQQSHTNDSLDSRWFRRRLGRIPPAGASAHRPISTTDVESAFDRTATQPTGIDRPRGLAMDVARHGGDTNVPIGLFGDHIEVFDSWTGTDHNANETRIRKLIAPEWDARFAIDAQGEGSGLADRIQNFYPERYRFNAGANAVDATKYKNCWTEGLDLLGDVLQTGSFSDPRLREELLAAARVIEYEERYYASRDTTVLKATSKDAVADQLGRSPDYLDAALMACWAASVTPRHDTGGPTLTSTPARKPHF
jgi:hypothetical protein